MTRSKRYISENMLFDGMSIEEKRKLEAEAKEHQATTQFKGGMHPVSAEASETDGHMSKEVARKIWKNWKNSFPNWKENHLIVDCFTCNVNYQSIFDPSRRVLFISVHYKSIIH